MKKNVTLVVVAVVGLAVGYLLGSHPGSVNTNKVKGDINALNTYNQLLTEPEYMAFTKSLSKDQDAIDRTISTLEIMDKRLAEYNNLARLVKLAEKENTDMTAVSDEFVATNTECQQAQQEVATALEAAKKLKNGEKVDLKAARKSASKAFECLTNEMATGKKYVQTVDASLKGKDISQNTMTATIRDMVASYCSVNALLTQDDNEIDYWSNLNGLVSADEMAALDK